MLKKVITSRPISDDSAGYLILEDEKRELERFCLPHSLSLTLKITEPDVRHCTGWYDIASHTNHVCEKNCIVNQKYDSCYECRQKTGFNPAFYNAASISGAQANYNKQSHSVYIAYFGDGVAKAGMMADSRGLQRIYEQGALFYYLVDSFEDATKAHNIEVGLINKGLLNSVTKRQKEKILSKSMSVDAEIQNFSKILGDLDYDKTGIINNLDHFFYGSRPAEPIQPIGDSPISGQIRGIIGRYLVLSNDGNLYGFWLDSLFGYSVEITEEIYQIVPAQRQVSLFENI